MVAMTVTLIVAGAIYGLLAGGQNAFRREPELADRQQNVRIAMDLIRRDVLDAGSGMVPFVQAFTNGLDGAGIAPATGQPTGASGAATDVIEMLTTDGNCQEIVLGAAPSAPAGPYASNEMLPACFPDNTRNAFVYVGGSAGDRLNYGVVLATADRPTGTAPFQILPLAPAVANVEPAARGFCGVAALGTPASTCVRSLAVEVVRYAIAPDPADASVPSLWRSSTGRFDGSGNVVANPPGGNWQLVARGIEDLQIRYRNGAGLERATFPATWRAREPARRRPSPTSTRSCARSRSPSGRGRPRRTWPARPPPSPGRGPCAASSRPPSHHGPPSRPATSSRRAGPRRSGTDEDDEHADAR